MNESALVSAGRSAEVIAVDDALTELESWDARKGRIVELRFFGGLSIEETADLLGLQPATVKTRLHRARHQLRRALDEQLASTLTEAFPFQGERCQRTADAVLERLHAGDHRVMRRAAAGRHPHGHAHPQ